MWNIAAKTQPAQPQHGSAVHDAPGSAAASLIMLPDFSHDAGIFSVNVQLLSAMQCDALQLHTLRQHWTISSAVLTLKCSSRCSQTTTLNKWTSCLAEQVGVSTDVCMNFSQQDVRELSVLKHIPFLQTAVFSDK